MIITTNHQQFKIGRMAMDNATFVKLCLRFIHIEQFEGLVEINKMVIDSFDYDDIELMINKGVQNEILRAKKALNFNKKQLQICQTILN